MCDRLTLMGRRRVLIIESTEAESGLDEVGPLEKNMLAAEKDTGDLLVVYVRFFELTTERASLTAGNKHAKTEFYTLAA